MNPLNLLIVTGIFPPDHGGPASYVPAVATALGATFNVMGVVTLSDSLTHDDSGYSFPVHRIARGQNKVQRRLETIQTIRRLAARADVVYLNGLVLEGIIACKVLSKHPVVVKVVGDLIWEQARNAGATQDSIDAFQLGRHGFRWQLLKRLQGAYTAAADAVITPSRYLAGIVAGWGVPKERIRVVYNAVETPEQPPAGTDRNAVDCVTVARLVPWKGVDELIRVAARNGWSLNIVGDGPMREELERLSQSMPTQRPITFLGHVPKAQVAAEIAKARVFILNSTYEGLPHIVLEAKSVGVPVVATAVGGTPETITDGVDGYLVPPGDETALGEGIRRASEPDHGRTLGEAGRRQVAEQFSFEKMVDETAAVLRDVAQGRVT